MGKQGLGGGEQEDVEGVAVVGQGPGDEAVVGGVHHGGVEDPVEGDHAGVLVQLVLGLASLGDLDDRAELVDADALGVHVVPDVSNHVITENDLRGLDGARAPV